MEDQRLVPQQIAQFILHVLRRAGPFPLEVKCLDMGVEPYVVLLVKVSLYLREVFVQKNVYIVGSHLERLLKGSAPWIGS